MLFVPTLAVWLLLAPEPVSVEWMAPEGCPEATEVRATIELLSGRSLDDPIHGELSARAKVTRADGGSWQLDFEVASSSGDSHKQIEARKCSTLADAVALDVALALEPLAVAEQVREEVIEPSTEQAQTTAQTPAPNGDQSVATAPALPPEPRRVAATLHAAGGVGLGTLPGVAGFVRLGPGIRGRAWRVSLLGTYGMPSEVFYAAPEDEVGGRFSLGTAGARACLEPTVGAVRLAACFGAQGGAMRGRGVGVASSQVEHRAYAAVVAGSGLRWVARRGLALGVDAQAVVPVVRPAFRVGDRPRLYVVPPAGFLALLALDFDFFGRT